MATSIFIDEGGDAPVFAELLAYPTRDGEFLGRFFRDTNASIGWDFNEAI